MASKTYTTQSGEMWDKIAWRALGSERHMGALLEANPEWADYYRLPSGVTLTLPEVTEKTSSDLPPWKQ